MMDASGELWQELSVMADAFADLGRRMLHASRLVHAPGILPADSLLDEVVTLRQAFASLRDRSCRLAESLRVPYPGDGQVNSLKALALLLDAAAEAETRQGAWSEATVRAVEVLQRVLRLRHVQQGGFGPLVACQSKARSLLRAIEDGPDASLEETLHSLHEMDHPFAYLLAMTQGAEGISDDLWESLFESVGHAFGRQLAAAVARGRIEESSTEAVEEPAALAPFIEQPALAAIVELAPEPAPVAVAEEPANLFAQAPLSAPEPASVLPILEFGEPVEAPGLGAGLSPLFQVHVEATSEPLGLDVNMAGEPQVPASDAILASIVSEALTYLPRGFSSLLHDRRWLKLPRRRSTPLVERLEPVSLMTANVISGYVFLDNNDNGLYEMATESPVANNTIELFNSSKVLIGETTTDANGFYTFTTDDTISTAPQTLSKTYTVPAQSTNFSQAVNVDSFDASLGTLTGVDVTISGTLNSSVKAENTSTTSGQTIGATASGSFSLTGPGVNSSTPITFDDGTFNVGPFDGTIDFAGASGHDFGAQAQTVSQTTTLTDAADLASYTGAAGGTVPLTLAANGQTSENGGGNTFYSAQTTASAQITVVYHYTPSNALLPGSYTVVQPQLSPGTLEGLFSRNGTVLPPGPPNVIPVTLVNGLAPNNDFGELKPSDISGFVYNDLDDNGLKSSTEPGIANVTIVLTGRDDRGNAVAKQAVTDANGAYDFPGLRPGTYQTFEPTQPAGFTPGLTTRGDVTPILGSNLTHLIPGIVVGFAGSAPNNDFAEITPGSPGAQTAGCDMPLPAVESVRRTGIHQQRHRLVLTFSEPLDGATATNPANYRLVFDFRDGKIGTREIPIKSVTYNPTTMQVTITPVAQLNIHYHYQLTVSGLKDTCGELFDGTNTGVSGGNFVTLLTKANYHRNVPAGPSAHVLSTANWAHTFPRLAAARGKKG